MSKRENIANDIITKLDAVTSPIEFKKLTREPFEVEELSDAQFPSAFIQAGDETREPASIGASGSGSYRGTIDFQDKNKKISVAQETKKIIKELTKEKKE